jgi:spore coat polysaccharide biosynthesis protein SpsF|tara:strand:- start:76 stop:837 length:762 start_codon:yes stop_codon:yes gene_type:complete
MNLGIFITCRNGSTRLPNKCNLKFYQNLSYIEFIFKRSFKVKQKCKRILCTTKKKEDLNLVKIAKKFKIESFRGDAEDKLQRWSNAAKKFKIDFFVTVDGDDPLFDPKLVDKAFKQYLNNKSEFIESKGTIYGLFTYGISVKALQKVCRLKNSKDTEMMSVYFTDTGLFDCEKLNDVNRSFFREDIRLTLDYPEDDLFFKKLVSKLKSKNEEITTKKIINIVNQNPNILKINNHRIIEWKKNQLKNTNLILKK